MESETREFRVVPIDGVLVDVRRAFIKLGSSLLRRPLTVPDDLDPPHTLGRLSLAVGLTAESTHRIRGLIGIIEDFWMTLPAIEGATVPCLLLEQPPIFYAKRVSTRGRSVLAQTIAWLEKHGFRNPIVWIEEE